MIQPIQPDPTPECGRLDHDFASNPIGLPDMIQPIQPQVTKRGKRRQEAPPGGSAGVRLDRLDHPEIINNDAHVGGHHHHRRVGSSVGSGLDH